MKIRHIIMATAISAALVGCGDEPKQEACCEKQVSIENYEALANQYAKVTLTSDISHLSANEKEMLGHLFEAGKIMDDIFWTENLGGDKDEFLGKIEDPNARKFAEINYGPWDQLDGLRSFIPDYGEMPAGAGFYPTDMTKEEFEAWDNTDKTSLYTLVRRDENGQLYTVWFHEAYKEQIEKAAGLLMKASDLAGDKEFAEYLKLRAQALLTDDYFESDMAWMNVRNNNVDFVVGPIENYVDALYGYKAAHESFILIKDLDWSAKLARYATLLPELQTKLPVPAEYKKEKPGTDADLAVYDVVFYGGDCNMGSKTIAINLPNDEKVQLQKGTRKLQLKNAMQAKFDQIVMPISNVLMTEASRQNIKFDAFFANVMFHEVAHGLGIKNTLNGQGTVRHALKEQYSAIEEAKADVLGLFLVTKLSEMGEYTNTTLEENYTTFMAGIFRSVRFGAASAHGKANMLTFNFLEREGAFTRNADGLYAIDFPKMKAAVEKLGGEILKAEGDGSYEFVKEWIAKDGVIRPALQADLDKVNSLGIPKDIWYEMGMEYLLGEQVVR
ncbi:MAG: Zn-dependent hydrolase [Bacteroidales bacterium]|nr:Zn-dependent hydrolase [Bacteroidales bacterium]MCQ2317092.1 Zn-dependent hydrolase [Bacteroidales bacterium]